MKIQNQRRHRHLRLHLRCRPLSLNHHLDLALQPFIECPRGKLAFSGGLSFLLEKDAATWIASFLETASAKVSGQCSDVEGSRLFCKLMPRVFNGPPFCVFARRLWRSDLQGFCAASAGSRRVMTSRCLECP